MYKIHYYNNHFLYIRTGVATEEQLTRSLESVIRRIGISCKYKINMVMITDKISHKELYGGYAHVWVENIIVSYMLTNRNPDGTERFFLDKQGKREYQNPLIILPGFIYNENQRNHLEKIFDHEILKKGYFEIDRDRVSNAPPNRITYLLIGVGIPEWINELYLIDQFKKYSSDPEFPKVTIEIRQNRSYSKRICFIHFNEHTHDGKFALIMTKRSKFINPLDNQDESLVYFNFYTPNEYSDFPSIYSKTKL